MTDPQPDEPLDPKPPDNETSAINQDGSAPSPEVATDPSVATDEGEEGLPEWEPLTPELVEDEAIRGDFVIRWAVVGLALLLGTAQISETRSLVHLKSGQHLISHGLIPAAKDVFSLTASDRKWVNLSWLFDIFMAGAYSISGGIGLSILQGLLAGLTFGLLAHAARPNIRTWWGSICAVLALLACYLQFTIQPELITLLGTSFVLWTLVRAEQPGQSKWLWSLVPVLWVWAQLDQRAWLGWFLLMLWAAGESISRDKSSEDEKGLRWKVAFASLALTAVHPFLWESWLAPIRMYMTDYPAMREAFPMPANAFQSTFIDQGFHPIWKPFVWTMITHRTIAALVLAGATLVTLILNRPRMRWSHLFAFVGFNALAVVGTHELAAASLVNCVISTWNAQTWYRERFGQVYSVDWRELLFSRGGRAITVLSFFAIAWLVLSGRLDGPTGRRTGIGFDSQLATAMSDYRSLNSDSIDDHPFNFSYRQGDLMIWGGQKPFIDSRLGLYYGSGSANLLAVHNKARLSLRSGGNESEIDWKSTFDKYQIRQAWPRLIGPFSLPDYNTVGYLLASKEFQLVKLNASTAVFVRVNPSDETTTAYLKGHSFDVVGEAFRETATEQDLSREWPRPATAYDRFFSLPRPSVPSGVLAAQHYLRLAEGAPSFSWPQRAACTFLAIRHANEGLKNEPNSDAGYWILGRAYRTLGQIESTMLSQGGTNTANLLRYFQSVAALQQAIALQPEDISSIRLLMQQYGMMGRTDAELALLQKLKQLVPLSKSMSDEMRKERENIINAIGQLEEPVERLKNGIEKLLGEKGDRLQIATAANQAGGLLLSISILEDNPIYLAENPQANLALGGWMMEAGRCREATEIFESLEALSMQRPFDEWRNPSANLAFATANYKRCVELWSAQLRSTKSAEMTAVLSTLPFVTLNPYWVGTDYSYPISNAGSVNHLVEKVNQEGAVLHYQIALAQIEMGANDNAITSIRNALSLFPTSPIRPLFRFYLECLTGEQIELKLEPAQTGPEEYEDLSVAETKADDAAVDKPK